MKLKKNRPATIAVNISYVNTVICYGNSLMLRAHLGFTRPIDRKCRPCLPCNKGIIFSELKSVVAVSHTEHAVPLLHGVNKKARVYAIPCAILRANKASINLNARLCAVTSRAREYTYRMIFECYYTRAYRVFLFS